MNHSDLVALLRDGVTEPRAHMAHSLPLRAERWADLGAGEGNFTFALAELLGAGSHITAIDKDRRAMEDIAAGMERRYPEVALEIRVADFTRELELSDLDGVVMANSLHFLRDKQLVLFAVREMLRPGGGLIVVEYGSDRGNPWVPHPFSYPTWERMAAQAGFTSTRLLRTIPSRHLGSMYSAISLSPEGEGKAEVARG